MNEARMHPELVRRLRDPVSGRPLLPADEAAFARALEAVRRLGSSAHPCWREGDGPQGVLLTDDGSGAYPVLDDMPLLLPEARVAL